MNEEKLYGYGPQEPFILVQPVNQLIIGSLGVIETPRMFWGRGRRFVQDKSLVVRWDGNVSPCYAYSTAIIHN